MKRFIPIAILVLVISSLASWATGVRAQPLSWVVSFKTNPSGWTGSVVFTDVSSQSAPSSTWVAISLKDAAGAPVTGPQAVGIYTGTCTNFDSTTPGPTMTPVTNGTSDSTVSNSLTTLEEKTSPTYVIVVWSGSSPGTVGTCGYIPEGMPSVVFPKLTRPFRVVLPPVTGAVLFWTPLGQSHTRVQIGVGGPSLPSPMSAFVRNGTCNKLDSTPVAVLGDVVNGLSDTIVPISGTLFAELAVDVELPSGPAGAYLACTEVSQFTTSADFQAKNNSGLGGQMTLTEQSSISRTAVHIQLTGTLTEQTLRARIYSGTCVRLRSATNDIARKDGNVVGGSLYSYASVPISVLTNSASPYAVVILQSNRRVACADIEHYSPPVPKVPTMPMTGDNSSSQALWPLAFVALGLIVVGLGLRRVRPTTRQE